MGTFGAKDLRYYGGHAELSFLSQFDSNDEIAHFEGEWVEESNQSTFSLHIHDGKIVFQTGKFEAELLQSDKGWCGALLNTESGVTKGEILLSPARLPDGEPVLISRHRSKSDEWGPATLAVKI